DGHGGREVLAAPANREGLFLGPDLAAVGAGDEQVLRRALGGLSGVAVSAQVDEAAVGGRLLTEIVGRSPAIDGRRLGTIWSLYWEDENRQPRHATDHGSQRPAVEAAIETLQMEIVVTAVFRVAAETEHLIHAEHAYEQRILAQAVLVLEGRVLPGGEGWPIRPFPEAYLARSGRVKVVIVALETGLAPGRHH